ncbi:MAG: signal peptidase II [Anaerolineae bacterium]|nr:signal peptidase II [Anaerolineae bacterium]
MAAVIFALDQATKYLVLRYIPEGGSWSFHPTLARIFQFTHITNSGAAFGSFPGLGDVFKFVAVFVIIGIIIFYYHLPTEYIGVRLSLGLIVGGAMGNLLDRFVRINEAVVDFVDIGFWPIFNVADISILVGVGILAYYLWNEEGRPKQEKFHPEGGKA